MSPELQVSIDAAIAKAVHEHNIAINGLTERQVCEAFKQAIACGDFERLVTKEEAQCVVYLPFKREQQLMNEIRRLRTALSSITQYREPIVSLQEVQAMAALALAKQSTS